MLHAFEDEALEAGPRGDAGAVDGEAAAAGVGGGGVEAAGDGHDVVEGEGRGIDVVGLDVAEVGEVPDAVEVGHGSEDVRGESAGHGGLLRGRLRTILGERLPTGCQGPD